MHFNTTMELHDTPTSKLAVIKAISPMILSVKTVHACPPNFKVSSPIFKCRMQRSGNSSQRFVSNVPTFQQNVRANLANFIQDFFWRVGFSNGDFKIVGDLGGPWRSSRFELECSGSRYFSKCGI